MTKKVLLISVLTIVVTVGAGVFILAQNKSSNTPFQNKQIERKAFQQKDDSLCKTIKGESYNFGPTDAQVSISQSEAQAQCHQNLKNGIEPALHGG